MASTADSPTSAATDKGSGSSGTSQQFPGGYSLSKFFINKGVELYGARIQGSPVAEDPVEHVKTIRALKLRDDDIILAAFPKCGTHWLWEVAQMLVNQTSDYEKRTKEHVMMEFCKPQTLDEEKSPRIFNTHLWMNHLPQEIITKKTKIIHVVRNPKDTLVSFFHHIIQMSDNKISFGDLMKVYMANDVLSLPHQLRYLRQMKEFERQHPDVPVKLIYFEEMKKDPVKTTKDLAGFLGVPASDAFCEEVAQACSFDKMKAADVDRELPGALKEKMKEHMKNNPGQARPTFKVYRKGTIGDWKNHFTVAQNEIFDDFIAQEMAKGLDYTFIYE